MVAERRDYVALDWVAAEIGDTLAQATAALDAYLGDTGDVTQLRFCLTYVHQVYGTLKMVEFAGAALLAEEMETTAHALLAGALPEAARHDALAALKVALARLPAYLQQLQKERIDRPTALLALINDLRALRGDALITESAIFSPALAPRDAPGAVLDIDEGELALAAGKLRQMYQMAMLNYLRGHEPRENLNYLAKVCARLAKLAGGQASEPLWKVAIALLEGLLNKSIPLAPAVKSLLQQIDQQIRAVADRGRAALREAPPPGLLKNLLYYIAASGARTRFIAEVKQAYGLATALPDEQAVDADAIAAVKAALARQLDQLAEDLAAAQRGGGTGDYGVLLLAELRRAQDTTALLGLNRAQQLLHDVAARLQSQRTDFGAQLDALRALAAELAQAPLPEPARPLFNDSEEAQEQLDKAFDAVLLEARNGLEQAKEAVIEFVANQWRHQCLEEVPALLAGIRGGLQLAGMERAARVLAACENYVRQDLLGARTVPAWQLLDTLADAIASVDYYLEQRAEGGEAGVENIIDVAEESVALLGYPVDGRIVERPAAAPATVISFPAPADEGERYDDHAGLEGETAAAETAPAPAPQFATAPAGEPGPVAPEPTATAADGEPAEDWAAALEPGAVPTLTAEAAAAPLDAAAAGAVEPAATAEPAAPAPAAIAAAAAEQPAEEPAAAEAAPLTVAVTAEPAFAAGEEPDPEIAEIFVEEAGEVLQTIDEYLPQWQQHPTDAESLTVIRRAFHTLKGSGRMVGATQIGELAWSVENMLNRVIDGTRQMDAARVAAVVDARALVPGLVAAFEQRLRPDMRHVQPVIDRAGILAREQELPAAAPDAPAPAPAPAAIPTLSEDAAFAPAAADRGEAGTETLDAAAFAEAPFPPETEEPAEAAADEFAFLEDPAEAAATESALPDAAAAPLAPEPPLVDDIVGGGPGAEPFIPFASLPDELAGAAGAAATEPADADDSDAESDRVLREIFAGEASTHLETLDAFIAGARAGGGPVELDDHLQRALHTLKGSAHMAGVAPIAEVVTPLEHLVKELRAAQIGADADVLALLEAGSALLHRGLAQLPADAFAPIAGADDWAARVALAYRDQLELAGAQAPQAGAEEPYSPARLGHFLGDAIELISAVADDLGRWRAGQLPDARHATLAGTIAQVADRAEALNIGAVTDLAQAFQSLLRRNAHLAAPEPGFFGLGARAAEHLIDMLDRLAANQEPGADEALLALLQDYEPGRDQAAEAVPADFDDAAPAEPPLLDSVVDLGADQAAAWLAAGARGDDTAAAAPEPEPDGTAASAAAEPLVDGPIDLIAEPLATEPLADAPIDLVAAAAELAAELPPAAAAAAPVVVPEDLDQLVAESMQEATAELAAELPPAVPEAAAPVVAPDDLDQLVAASIQEATAELAAELAPATPEAAEPVVAPDDLDQLVAASMREAAAELAELPAGAVDESEPLAGDLVDFDALDGETVDLAAAFAAPLQPHGTLPGDAVSEYLEAFAPPLPTPTATPERGDGADDDIDAEILDIFLEEAGDLLEGLDETLHAWNGERDNPAHLDELQRLLHTLKGGARLAGLRNLGNLAHNFETLLINTQQQQRPVDDALLAQVHNYQDQLVRMVDAVRSGGHGADADTEIEADTAAAAEHAAESADAAPESAAAAPADELALDTDSDDDGVIVPFPAPAQAGKAVAPRPAGEFLATPLGADVEELPDLAAGALLRRGSGPQEVVKISAQLLEQLVNLAGETSIARSRSEEQVNEFVFALDEMQITVDRLQEQVRRLDIETEAQVIHRQEQVENTGLEGFDPLEFDRYSLLQQLSRSLLESASDLIDIKNTLAEKSRDMETLLVQQARINTELQEGLMRSRMVPFARMVPRLRRIVRQIAGELGKQVDFLVDNAEGELDRTVLERIVAPLEHMLRNAVDHGIEAPSERLAAGKPARGTILLSLAREGGEIALRLSDDGRGIDLDAVRTKAVDRGLMAPAASLSDHEVLQFILESGFSTARQVTQISGRGVGMDVVASEIKQLGGALEIDSIRNSGTRFTVRLPFTVSVNRALMVSVGGDIYAIPLNSIEGIVRVSPFELEAYYQPEAPLFEYAGQPYQMRYMGSLLRTGERPLLEGQTMPLPVLLVRGADHAVAVQVDGLMGSREIVVKTLGPQFGMVHGLSGATVLGDGSVVVILDLMAMIRADALHLHRDHALQLEEAAPDRSRPQLVMVVDDSVTVRKVTSRFLERQGMEVMLAKDGVDAINLLQESERVPDVMLLDIEMPRMDGFEVASRVRHSSRWQDLPIIMITSRTGEKHRERAFALGVNKYLGKPYQEMVLLETIYELTGTTAPL